MLAHISGMHRALDIHRMGRVQQNRRPVFSTDLAPPFHSAYLPNEFSVNIAGLLKCGQGCYPLLDKEQIRAIDPNSRGCYDSRDGRAE
jgi:hypothetical protein